ncbi:MAG: tetratricopeptide repeat protein [Acidobacteria bacterium]|nr:tetratricopeptide repeat protein [Acidobacteriota bacterium]
MERGYAAGGYREAMRRAAEKLEARSKLTPVQASSLAILYVEAGQKDRALEWLEKAYQEHDSITVYIGVDPQWDSLRADPLFQNLVRRIRFPANG